MSNHTPEPWKISHDDSTEEWSIITNQHGSIIANVNEETGPELVGSAPVMRKMPGLENARRIVACVNACAGIPNEVLEMDQPQFVAILKQRAELAEAIRLTLDENGHLADGDVCTLKRLKDALAKVGAGTTATKGHNAGIHRPRSGPVE